MSNEVTEIHNIIKTFDMCSYERLYPCLLAVLN